VRVDRIVEVTDQAMARALAHPLRRSLLTALRGRTASPRELAAEMNVSLPKLSYHVRQLAAAGLLLLVRERPRRGVTEHFYTAAGRTHIPAHFYDALPDPVRHAIASSWLSDVGRTVEQQLADGAYENPDARLHRVSAYLDETARGELAKAVDDLYELVLQLERRSDSRLASTASTTMITLLSSGPGGPAAKIG
jgi:DNA-binding transcriptional ArsR family regulator